MRSYLLTICMLGMLTAGCGEDDTEPPRVTIWEPASNIRSKDARIELRVEAAEDTQLDLITLYVNGVVEDTAPPPRDGACNCYVDLQWDTLDDPAGEYTLLVEALDFAGNVGSDTINIELVDRFHVQRIRVTDEADDGFLGGGLEVEVHLRDADDGLFLGCTGGNQDMSSVVAQDVNYTVASSFITPADIALTIEDIAGRNLIARVIENDDDICPMPDTGDIDTVADDDDLLGVSEPFAALDFEAGLQLQFPGVPMLDMKYGRADP